MTDFEQALEACRGAGIETGAWSKDLQYGWSSGHASETRDATDSDRFELLGRMVGWLMSLGYTIGPSMNQETTVVFDGKGNTLAAGRTPLSACAAAVRAVGRGD